MTLQLKQLARAKWPSGRNRSCHVFLAISERGEFYALMEELWLLRRSIEETLEGLVLGRQSRKVT